jgi:hypothetical protein
MTEVPLTRRVGGAILACSAVLLAGCAPAYMGDTHTTSTPRPQSFDIAELARGPVATLGLLTPAGLQGFSHSLSHALILALSDASPPVRGIPSHETVNVLNEQGLAAEYADLISGFVRSGILERARLQRIGSALGPRYVLLPGLAEFNQVLLDKFEAFGVKLVKNWVTTLRLWLQLWDTQTGQILSSGGSCSRSLICIRSCASIWNDARWYCPQTNGSSTTWAFAPCGHASLSRWRWRASGKMPPLAITC